MDLSPGTMQETKKEYGNSLSHVELRTNLQKFEGAHQASTAEHEQTLGEALKTNRKAVLWSILISMTIIMEGYDTGLIGNFFAYPPFERTYGQYDSELGRYVVSAPWQAGLSNGAVAGVIIGGFANGFLSARYGYKKVILGALFFMNCFVFIPFFAKKPEHLLVGQVL